MTESECVEQILSVLDNPEVSFVTVAPESYTVRGWTGLFSYFSDCFGGHFDSSEHLIANVCLESEDAMNAALKIAVPQSKRKYVRFSAEPLHAVKGSCCILVPCRMQINGKHYW